MRYLIVLLILLGACQTDKKSEKPNHPKLVVGIVIDQMRYEMLNRYEPYFGENGFKRLRREGFEYHQNYLNYAQTLTAPGHASIATGTPPSVHGIAGNGWFDVTKGDDQIYCIDDGKSLLLSLNPQDSTIFRSPANLMVGTVGDQFKSAFGEESKVIGISLKDRAANLSSGKNADAAFWMMRDGYWGSSSYFFDSLPDWVNQWNNNGALWKYSDSTWMPLVANYQQSLPDSSTLESSYSGFNTTTFPYDFKKIVERNGTYELWCSPYGDIETRLFFQYAFEELNLGKDEIPDFVGLSFSSTDKVGHSFGPYSQEIADEYVRLDIQLAKLLNFLDDKLGRDQYLIYLTSDHGTANIPGSIDSVYNGGGAILTRQYCVQVNDSLAIDFGIENLILAYKDEQVYFDIKKIESLELDLEEVLQKAGKYFEYHEGIQRAVAFNKKSIDKTDSLVLNGVFRGRSGHIFLVYEPGWIETKGTGTDHGVPHKYDRHVPLLWFGKGIKQGVSDREVSVTQIAPTLCKLLGIEPSKNSSPDYLDELLSQ